MSEGQRKDIVDNHGNLNSENTKAKKGLNLFQ